MINKVTSIKGTDTNMQCRGFQFEVGKTYNAGGKIKACSNGFHACPVDHHPFSVFEYYPPSSSRYLEVTQSGDLDADDNKLASAQITINAELSVGDLVMRAVNYVLSRATVQTGASATGDRGAASATGYRGAASATGYWGAASATGYRGAASASNGSAALANGFCGKVRGETDDCPLYAAERSYGPEYKLLSVASGITGRDGIKAGVWYVCKDGKLVEMAK